MRFRDLGITVGTLQTGQYNAITDVAGVRVGHHTLIERDDIRTGVTAILPHGDNLFTDKVVASAHTINGFGKACGFEQVRELGTIETPILLTNTLNVGIVADASVAYTLQDNPKLRSVNPLVGECNDGYLNDIHQRAVREAHVLEAIQSATSGAVAEGCVGAGTGTICYGYKGGIGTASRKVGDSTIGVLMQTNFGTTSELTMLGVPIGHGIETEFEFSVDDGSVMIVIATDAPLTSRQLGRLAKRVPFGLGRTGTICHHGSGDFVIAFTTASTQQTIPDHHHKLLNGLFQGVVECVEESIYNSITTATTMTGFQGRTVEALSTELIEQFLRHYNRIG